MKVRGPRRALVNLGIDQDQAGETVLWIVGRGTNTGVTDITDVTKWNLAATSKRSIELAVDEGRQLKQDYIGTGHLLLGLIRERNGGAAAVLASLGVTPEQIRAQVLDLIATIGEAVKPAELKAPKNNVVMCRLDDRDLDAIDMLIEAGICNTRSDAAAWLIHAGIEANATLLTSARDIVAEIRRMREVARALAQQAVIRDAGPASSAPNGDEDPTPGESST